MTKQDLEQIRFLDNELKMWERELVRQRSKSANRDNDNIKLERDIEAAKAEIQQLRDEAVPFILSITDRLTRMIVYYRCVRGMSWRRVACEIGGGNTEGSVKMAYKRFLDSD